MPEHEDGHEHGHGHGHEHVELCNSAEASSRGVILALIFTSLFFVVQLVGGIFSNSLALITNAWHVLDDVLCLAFALVTSWIARFPITKQRTYGYYRAEVISSLFQVVFLWVILVFIFYEAFQRLLHPAAVNSLEMLLVAALGFLFNILSVAALFKSAKNSLNVKSAFVHVLSDALSSIGVMAAAVIIFYTRFYLADPILSFIIGFFILYTSLQVLKEALNVLLEGVPSHIDVAAVERSILKLDGVKSLHDLHVWCITPSHTCALSAHVVIGQDVDRKKLITALMNTLKEEFGVDHPTIQLEDEDYPKAIYEH